MLACIEARGVVIVLVWISVKADLSLDAAQPERLQAILSIFRPARQPSPTNAGKGTPQQLASACGWLR